MIRLYKKLVILAVCCTLLVGCAGDSQSEVPLAEAVAADLAACTLATDEGCYVPEAIFTDHSTTLTYIDYASKQQVFVCTRPNCTHHEEGCTAWFAADDPISQFTIANRKLLITLAIAQQDLLPHIDTLNLDGTNRQTLATFPANMSIDTRFYADEETLFFLADIITQEAPDSAPILDRSLYALTLKTGAYQILYTFPNHDPSAFFCGANGRELYVATIDATNGTVLTRPFTVDTAQWGDFIDGSTQGADVYIQDNTFLELNRNANLLTLYSAGDGQAYSYDYTQLKAQQPQPLLQEPNFVYLYDYYCRAMFISVVDNTSQFNDYIINMQSGEVTPFSMWQSYDGGTIAVIAQREDDLLVWRDTVEVAIPGRDGLENCYYMPIYALISKEDYAHSVQNFTEIASPLAAYLA